MDKILLIGKASTYSYLNDIQKITSLERAGLFYGVNNDLYRAAQRAFELKCSEIYLCNVQVNEDYFDIIPQIRDSLFDYVVLPGLYFKEKIKIKNKIKPLYAALIETIAPTHTRFFLTDYHIENFYTTSDFLSHYNNLVYEIQYHLPERYWPYITLTANHLEDSFWAAIDSACALALSPIGKYPALDFGNATKLLETSDFAGPVIYFKNNTLIDTTVENLFNFYEKGLEGNLLIQNLLFVINNELQNDSYRGKRFRSVILKEIEAKTRYYLDSKVGSYFENYRITDIAVHKSNAYVVIEILIEILPFFTYDTVEASLFILGG